MNFIKTVLAVLVAQVLIGITVLIGFGFFTALLSAKEPMHVEEGSWLVVDVYGEIEPYDLPESIVGSVFGGDEETLTRILTNLEKAAADPRIAGVIVKVSSSNTLGYASLGELRDAIHHVQESGKPVIAYADALDRNSLYLASACDSTFMPGVGDVILTGFGYVDEFYKGTLDKLAIKPNLSQIKDYKTFAESFTRASMSPQAKEMANWLINEGWSVELGAISRDRSIPIDSLAADMNRALFTADEAKAAGLIDDVRYWDEIEERYGENGELTTVTPEDYAKVTRAEAGLKGKHRIAVVHAYGVIAGRTSHTDPTFGVVMGHETVIDNLRDAAENKHVDAVIFRVDSPGGESLASELIAREVAKVASEKPIIVSMGDVAASGGYAISYRATKIVADSLTITGSIGSIYGKMNIMGLWNKLGITFDWVTRGSNALLWSELTDFDEAQWKRIEQHHNASFDRWLADIAEARKIPVDELRPLTEGRVWTGRQAKERGLIDEVGGYAKAVEVAKEAAGIAADEEVAFVHYPKRRGLYSMLTTGNAPLTLMRLAMYRWLHDDVAMTLHSLQQGELRLWTGRVE